MQKKLPLLKISLLLFITFLVLSCSSKFYNLNIPVERHLWQLIQIDTFYAKGKFRPSATWYSKYDGLHYIDKEHEFPYPFVIGTYLSNFDRK